VPAGSGHPTCGGSFDARFDLKVSAPLVDPVAGAAPMAKQSLMCNADAAAGRRLFTCVRDEEPSLDKSVDQSTLGTSLWKTLLWNLAGGDNCLTVRGHRYQRAQHPREHVLRSNGDTSNGFLSTLGDCAFQATERLISRKGQCVARSHLKQFLKSELQ